MIPLDAQQQPFEVILRQERSNRSRRSENQNAAIRIA